MEHHQKLAKRRLATEKKIRAREARKEKQLLKSHKAELKEAIRKARLPDPAARIWTHEEIKAQPHEYKKFKKEEAVHVEKKVAAVKARVKANHKKAHREFIRN